MTLAKAKTISDMLAAWVSILAAVFAGWWALTEYRGEIHKSQVERVLAYLHDFDSPENSASRTKLFQALQDQQHEIDAVLTNDKQPIEEINRLYSQLIVQTVDSGDRFADFLSVAQLLEEISLCVNKSLCDGETVQLFFLREGRGFVRTWMPYICKLRRDWNMPEFESQAERYFNPSAAGKACPS